MSTLIQYEPFVDSTTELFLFQTEKLYSATNETCDFAQWLQFYAFDVIGDMTYSSRHGFLEQNRDIDGIVKYLGKLFNYVAPVSIPFYIHIRIITHYLQIGQIPFLDLLFLKNPLYLLAAKYKLIDATFPVAKFAQDRMAERLSQSSTPTSMSKASTPDIEDQSFMESKPRKVTQPDLLSKFIAARTSHPEFVTQSHVLTLAVSMAFAGSETTAISLSSVFYYLLKNPTYMSRVLQELDDAARRGGFQDCDKGLVTWAEAQRLPYLDACIKESFRMHPAAGLPLERIVPPSGAEIAGHFIPGGTIVGCSAWVIHRRPEIFGADVDAYRPERWLIDASQGREKEEARIKAMEGTMFHFGMGARTCIGKNISLLEIYKLVPSMLRRFQVSCFVIPFVKMCND
jgi:hypothetical protein